MPDFKKLLIEEIIEVANEDSSRSTITFIIF